MSTDGFIEGLTDRPVISREGLPPALPPAAAWAAKALTVIGGLIVAVLAGWVVLTGAMPTFNAGGVITTVLYDSVIFIAAGVCALRAACGSRERAAWGLLAAAIVAWLFGELYYDLFLASVAQPPIPSPSDIGYLVFYPLAAAGLGGLLRSRLAHIPAAVWVDGIIAACAASALLASVVFSTVLASVHGDTGVVVTGLAYPVGDLILMALLVAAIAASRMRVLDRTWGLLTAGLLLFATADSVYLVQTAHGSYVSGKLLDLGWPLALLLMGAAAWQPVRGTPTLKESRASITVAVASALVALEALVLDHFKPVNPLVFVLAALCLVAVCARLVLAFVETQRALAAAHTQALTDPVTGLGNRYQLTADLKRRLHEHTECPGVLLLADLDGFKSYNDTFGHLAGDELLHRLGVALAAWTQGQGRAYRMGGDEFCALIDADEPVGSDLETLATEMREALAERGSSFEVESSCGAVALSTLPSDNPSDALRAADRLMYANKNSARASAFMQTKDVLMAVLAERDEDLHRHVRDVAGRAVQTARELGLSPEEIAHIRHAAQLHDIGKTAIPRDILQKPDSLTAQEWQFMYQHTVIGERIAGACPALSPVAPLIRSSHERYDGGGYPDALVGEAIPLGARIVSVCDSFDAMTSERSYSRAMREVDALMELRRCAGHQFDPLVVAAFIAAYERAAAARPAPVHRYRHPPAISPPICRDSVHPQRVGNERA